ncbi:putative nucleolar G-protein [Guillardia theta]|uniref:Putative nucleolar G-protein n=1 Tax=Guillardia theta TaxID=55529 RepID=Q9AW63_GUITH|nr:putative nucleolar G-protein [Guillardia theta]CAC27007.1 putative nucleolar G-protein [Guillardia theta]|mmetsp:Transcript_36713/g.114620  ORF Transcript_36713/g.114620 Transcript_36713/m.114620 type:complete len:397 (+) Transcript_36713:1980-3170(+)
MIKILTSVNLIDNLLSKTQRKTPTYINKHVSIARIKSFYIKKLLFVKNFMSNYLNKIIEFFPKIVQLHHFYRNLFTRIFDRNYYKVNLSKINWLLKKISNLTENYKSLIHKETKFYRCKILKKTFLGKICKVIKKINNSLLYLEQIRLNLKAIPAIDPYKKSIIIIGTKLSGKTNLFQKLTRFKFKKLKKQNELILFNVGHYDYNLYRYQVIDTKFKHNVINKIRSTKEIFVSLDKTIIFFLDPSILRVNPLQYQILSFNISENLFKKPFSIMILGKTDLLWEKIINDSDKTSLNKVFKKYFYNCCFVKFSNHDELGVTNIKNLISGFISRNSIGKISNQFQNKKCLGAFKNSENIIKNQIIVDNKYSLESKLSFKNIERKNKIYNLKREILNVTN